MSPSNPMHDSRQRASVEEDTPSQETNRHRVPDERADRRTSVKSEMHTPSVRSTRRGSTFAEALLAVDSVTSAPEAQVHREDRLDAMLLEELEQEDDVSARGSVVPVHDRDSIGARGFIRAGDLPSTDSLYQYAAPEQIRIDLGAQDDEPTPSCRAVWLCHGRTLCKRLMRCVACEFISALFLLATSIAVIAAQGPPVVDPTLAVGMQQGNRTVTLEYGFADDIADLRQWQDINMLRDLLLLMLRPLYALVIARFIALLLGGVAGSAGFQRLLPGAALLVIQSVFGYAWALPAMLFPAVCGLLLTVFVDKHAWRQIFSLPLFLPMAMWLMSAGLSLVIIDAAVQLWQNHLAVQHYENRSQHAYEHQRALRKIVAAVCAAERKTFSLRGPDADARSAAPDPIGSAIAALQQRLAFMTGSLDFGSDVQAAATVAQARRRALRLFRVILRQPQLRVAPDADSSPVAAPPLAVDRHALIAWAYRTETAGPPPRLAAELFSYGPVVDADHFVKAVERSYKEQRLITASVASFDRLHAFLLHGLQVVWGLIMLTVLLMLWGIDLLAWLLPVGSALLVLLTLAGGLTTDLVSSFFFAYVTRPYDIGDRVSIATPGHASALYSMVVKDIFLMRTHFLTANGESMMVNNSTVKNMALTNYARSGKLTLVIELMVPAATPSAKISELTDAIAEYVKEKSSEWSAVDLMFGDALLDKGHLVLNIWPTSVFQAHEVVSIYSAKSRLLRFCHAYMQSANIEYVQPVQPFRESPTPGAEGGGGGFPFGAAATPIGGLR